MKYKKHWLKASITIEAATLLPFFVLAIMSFVSIIKIYYTNEILQHAISSACSEMSVYSLLYYENNAEEIIGGIEKLSKSDAISETLGDNEITSFIQQLGKDATDYVRAQIALIPFTKALVKRNLNNGNFDSVDDRLKALNLANGFEGIDFSGSRMLADGKSIDIKVIYEIRFPFLSDLIPGVKLEQNASACIWAGEDGISFNENTDNQNQNIWDMTNIKRGREIRLLQGANLPFNFPVIAKFNNGTATSIKSLNIDEIYYKNNENLSQKLLDYINRLDEFSGGESGNISISSYVISRKELLIIIPETQVLPNQQLTIDECSSIARAKGIELKIVKAYGKQTKGKDVTDIDKEN